MRLMSGNYRRNGGLFQRYLNAARIWEKGWGVDVDKEKANKLRQDATAHYNKMNKTQLSVAQVEETIQP